GTSVQPGDRVDIIATYQDPRTRQELTKMILQNVMVLAVNRGKTDADGKEGANSSMTLEVTPEQTERVTAAARSGSLRASLRAPHTHRHFHLIFMLAASYAATSRERPLAVRLIPYSS